MGVLCSSCLKGKPAATEDLITPDIATRRRLQEEAAARRQQTNETRGIKDPEKVRRQQERAREMEIREREMDSSGGPALKWQAN